MQHKQKKNIIYKQRKPRAKSLASGKAKTYNIKTYATH